MHSNPMHDSLLWKRSLGPASGTGPTIERLRTSLDSFRARVEVLIQSIRGELPGLTVHDITHLDALWRVAGEIVGTNYPLNPAESYVLGGAILLHDAAHVLAAYPNGLADIKGTPAWKDVVAQQHGGNEPEPKSVIEREIIFRVLRSLHARQARKLATISWNHPESGDSIHLIEDDELRRHYGDLVGKIAESHHWSIHRVASEFANRTLPAPGFLEPEGWTVDALKIALILRTADAAHMDSLRAPWFLFALEKPSGISLEHWRFQSRMSQPRRDEREMLVLASGAPFEIQDRNSWWLAYDTARMVDSEIRASNQVLEDYHRPKFPTSGVLDVQTPSLFSRQVPTEGWTPIDASPKVGNTPKLISMLGGRALYGDNLAAALRELLQNAIDATHALRRLGGLSEDEGLIEVLLEPNPDETYWLHVSDVGIGMSRHVMVDVLLDFGRSLWTSPDLLDELPGLASTGFEPIGKFGIGFFAIFMLGEEIKVVSRRFEPIDGDSTAQWKIAFEGGIGDRPVLSEPDDAERLKRSGTRVSVKISRATANKVLESNERRYSSPLVIDHDNLASVHAALLKAVSSMCPTSDVGIRATVKGDAIATAISPNDWKTMDDSTLSLRASWHGEALTELRSGSGELLGRLAPTAWYNAGGAAITVNGVRNGVISGLVGVVISREGGTEANRTNARPAGSIEDWSRWANEFASAAKKDRTLATRMQPLLPTADLPVWTVAGNDSNQAELEKFLDTVDEVYLHSGDIDHESADDVAESAFARFQIMDFVVTAPRSGTGSRDFAARVGASMINYEERFAQILTRCWGQWELITEDYCVVGTVDGEEITRLVNVYARATQELSR
jgi:hypothetical protein